MHCHFSSHCGLDMGTPNIQTSPSILFIAPPDCQAHIEEQQFSKEWHPAGHQNDLSPRHPGNPETKPRNLLFLSPALPSVTVPAQKWWIKPFMVEHKAVFSILSTFPWVLIQFQCKGSPSGLSQLLNSEPFCVTPTHIFSTRLERFSHLWNLLRNKRKVILQL